MRFSVLGVRSRAKFEEEKAEWISKSSLCLFWFDCLGDLGFQFSVSLPNNITTVAVLSSDSITERLEGTERLKRGRRCARSARRR